MRDYQRDFSLHSRNVHDIDRRRLKAQTIIRVLSELLGPALADATVLDVGASTGAITAALGEHVREVIGLDIDEHAIAIARERYASPGSTFQVGDAMQLEVESSSVDVVLCAHVYEHVPDPTRMMGEIRRVLKPGGWCYFSAGNRLAIDEPHYHLPLLSIVPKWLAHPYLRLSGRGQHYYEEHQTLWGLRRLVAAFRVVDYTRPLIAEPERYGTAYMLTPGSLKQRLALFVIDRVPWLCPGFIWLLQKPACAGDGAQT